MNYPIVKSFVRDKTAQQIEQEGGAVNFCSWQRLLPQLAEACGLKPNEEIIGVFMDNSGINIRIRTKKETNPTPPI